MTTLTRHTITSCGVVSIEIEDSDGGYIELIPDETGITIDALCTTHLDAEAVASLIMALTNWQQYQRLL